MTFSGQTSFSQKRLSILRWGGGSIGGVPTTPDPILLQKYRDTNGRRIVIQTGGVYTVSVKRRAYFCKSIAIEMGGVSRHFSNISGSGVVLILPILGGQHFLNLKHGVWFLYSCRIAHPEFARASSRNTFFTLHLETHSPVLGKSSPPHLL